MLWVWIAVVVVALVILLSATVPLFGRLGRLDRAVARLRIRQEAAQGLQARAEELQQTVAAVQERVAAVSARSHRP
jgi:hypothetical protein